MFQQEEMRDAWKGEAFGYAGDARFEEASPYGSAGQKLSGDASGQAPTAVQRLALVSLGMLMGMSILLTILTTATKEISHPRFAAFYNWMMGRPLVRRGFDPLRRETVGQAHGVVLEVGAGGGQNFSFYDPTRVERVEAVEPDKAMLVEARRSLAAAPVPINLARAPVEALPFPDASFDSAVVMLVFCSVRDPERGLREIWRVLKPEGDLVLLEHVRAQGTIAARIQDVLVPLTTRCMGNCHWNRATQQTVLEAGFRVTQLQKKSGGLQPVLLLHATRDTAREEMP